MNREVAGGAGIPFEHHNLAEKMEQVLAMSTAEREEWRRRALERVSEHYDWERVADAYEELLVGLYSKATQ